MGSNDCRPEDLTLPPQRSRRGAICPRCGKSLTETTTTAGHSVARCPEHGLALVEVSELSATGGDPLLGTTIGGRFTILARLGYGSMGAVYRARQEAVGRDVALKVVRSDRAYDNETKTRFEREARATSQLTSPHTVTVFDFGEAGDGSWYLAMELLDGETLGERLRRAQRLPWPEAVRVAREALKSLAEAHGKGIVHRDLKPDNLFLAVVPDAEPGTRLQVCKVLDFGIAKLMRDEAKVDQLETQAGTVFGTPRYMSPEQAQGNPLDARSDLYSLGVILYQMLTGRAPFVDDDAVVVMARHIKDQPPSFAQSAPGLEIPVAIEQVVLRALAKRPEQRPATAEKFSAELSQALEQSGVVSTGAHATWVGPTSSPEGVSAPPKRGLRTAFLMLAGSALLVGVGFVLLRTLPGEPSPDNQVAGEKAPIAAAIQPTSISPPAPSASADAPDAGDSSTKSRKRASRARPAAAVAPKSSSSATKPTQSDRYGRFE